MAAKSIGILCYSLTNTTRRICTAVAFGMGSQSPRVLDMTLPNSRAEIIANSRGTLDDIDHLIVGAPVYAGKIPRQAVECLTALRETAKECTAIVVYGNRDYGIALHSMAETLSRNCLTVVAAGALIGQHSYSDIIPVAVGRPDKSDIEKAREFGTKVSSGSKPLSVKDVPVQTDYFTKSDKYFELKPSYDQERCVECGKCATVCPLGLLSSEGGGYLSQAAKKRCTGCMACVRNCEHEARVTKANPIVKMVMTGILRQASKERKEPVVIV
jgi:Pyruvate/2-oxoacid:ferredoxin oxidoreductase delta subunit